MLKPLRYKNTEIKGFFIDQNGKIYDEKGNEQKQKLYTGSPYYFFKSHKVHIMLAHSFFAYKPGYVVHHKNFDKTNNSLDNLVYLTREEHTKIHMTGKAISAETKKKMSVAHTGKMHKYHKGKSVYCPQLNKVFESISQAAKELKLSCGHICMCCKGQQKTCGKLHFKYFD